MAFMLPLHHVVWILWRRRWRHVLLLIRVELLLVLWGWGVRIWLHGHLCEGRLLHVGHLIRVRRVVWGKLAVLDVSLRRVHERRIVWWLIRRVVRGRSALHIVTLMQLIHASFLLIFLCSLLLFQPFMVPIFVLIFIASGVVGPGLRIALNYFLTFAVVYLTIMLR